MQNEKTDSVLITVPLSSPLHPKASMIFLQSYLRQCGYAVKAFDTNVKFFNWFLRAYDFDFKDSRYANDPIQLLNLYNSIEEWLACEAKRYEGFRIDLRTVGFKYDRLIFADIVKALTDETANPFVAYYREFVTCEIVPLTPRMVCIGMTFQDNIIAAFTLADQIRKQMSESKIVLGGQMITRCYDTMIEDSCLHPWWDYLVCWDGEIPLECLHEKICAGHADRKLVNVIAHDEPYVLDRQQAAFDLNHMEHLSFDDVNFDEYFYPDVFVPLQTARGCYGSCEFCAIPLGSNTGFRERSVEKILADIVNVQQHTQVRYGKKATYFKFMDDTTSPKTLRELAQTLEAKKIDAKWETYVRMDAQFEDPSFMEQLYRGGCRKLMWGLETNDPEILKNMAKKVSPVSISAVLDAASDAGILNFAFVLLGFPGETETQRQALAKFIIEKRSLHVLTVATFDVTKWSRMQVSPHLPENLKIEVEKPRGFEVRLPYSINGENWKKYIVSEAHKFMVKITRARPDIALVSLFPDQVRAQLTDKHGNEWGRLFLNSFGEERIVELLNATEQYAQAFANNDEIELAGLPDPLKREHLRTQEDIAAIAHAIKRRKQYETKRADSI
jgi:radical SAM superfamily enzyme YgiQ (UPF0313 family)